MNYFSINDIESLTGVKAHTLRIWEQRYGICTAQRKESGHRFYDDNDLKAMLRLVLLYKNGHRISQLACLQEDDIRALTLANTPPCAYDALVNQLMEATQAFDQVSFDRLLHMLILHLGFEKCVLEIMFPFLERMGMLWLTDRAIPAQEHFSSNLIQKKIIVAIDGLETPPPSSGRKVLLYTPEGEAHEIPLLFMQYMLKKYGTRTVYMGKEVATETLRQYCIQHPVTHVYLHLITHLGPSDPAVSLSQLAAALPHVKVVVSGQCVMERAEDLDSSIQLLRTNADLFEFARGQ